MKLVRILLERF